MAKHKRARPFALAPARPVARPVPPSRWRRLLWLLFSGSLIIVHLPLIAFALITARSQVRWVGRVQYWLLRYDTWLYRRVRRFDPWEGR